MDVFADYESYDAVGLAELVTAGEVTPEELVETAIDRVERVNPGLNAVIATHFDRARSQARESGQRAPFHGVPFLTKDLAMVAGDSASFGSVFFRDFRPDVTDEYQLRIRRAGLIPIGRTNSPEFGLLPTTEPTLHGPTRNPWDRTRSAGGSSGGAAAATAAGIVPMAHASDGGGSIRIPASACGLFGLKPSRGRMPRYPGSAADYLSLDLAVSRTVRDVACLLDAYHGAVAGSAYYAPPPKAPFSSAVGDRSHQMRIAYATTDFRGHKTDPDCIAAVEATVGCLSDLDHSLVEDKPAIDGQSMAEAFLVVWEALAESIFVMILDEAGRQRRGAMLRRLVGDWRAMKLIAWLDQRKSGKDAFEPFTWSLAERSRRRSPALLEAARSELQRSAHLMGEFLAEYDSFLTPVLGTEPISLGTIDQEADWEEVIEHLFAYVAFTPVANFSGLPAMSVPTYWSDAGLPIGVHFMGPFGDEYRMLSLAAELEQAMPWVHRRPPI